MADDWEDWEADDYVPQLPATVGQAALAKASEPDAAKFAGEDEDVDERPAWEKNVPNPQEVGTSHIRGFKSSIRTQRDIGAGTHRNTVL